MKKNDTPVEPAAAPLSLAGSSTPYKDELIRVAALLGLPDDVDAGKIADRVGELVEADRRRTAEGDISALAQTQRNTFRDALRELTTYASAAVDDLARRRERAGSPGAAPAQAFADMTAVADGLRVHVAKAEGVLAATL